MARVAIVKSDKDKNIINLVETLNILSKKRNRRMVYSCLKKDEPNKIEGLTLSIYTNEHVENGKSIFNTGDYGYYYIMHPELVKAYRENNATKLGEFYGELNNITGKDNAHFIVFETDISLKSIVALTNNVDIFTYDGHFITIRRIANKDVDHTMSVVDPVELL